MKISIVMLSLVSLVGVGHADSDKDKADALFKQGKKLLGEKRFADACHAFEQSYKLDPGIGGELNVARCYEEWGKLAHAYRMYVHAEQMANDAHDARVSKIHERVEGLEPAVPRITINLPANADASTLTVTLDGVQLATNAFGKPQLVDPGPHQIDYQAGSSQKKTKVVPVERGGNSEIQLDVPASAAHDDKIVTVTHDKVDKTDNVDKTDRVDKTDKTDKGDGGDDRSNVPAHPGRGQRIAGVVIGSAGVVAVGVSGVLALSARSKYRTALSQDCGGMTDTCDPAGLTATHDARSDANVATIVFGVGLAAIAGGIVVYVLAPHASRNDEHAFYVVPNIAADGGGLVLGGRL